MERETGRDTYGTKYTDIVTMWEREVASPEQRAVWYREGNQYWCVRTRQDQAATIAGVLGGLEEVHEADIEVSRAFLTQVLQDQGSSHARAVDCGAGIGRVTRHLLLPLFASVDLVEQCQKYIEAAQLYVNSPQVGSYFALGLQDFSPETAAYDAVWVQWVLPYLTDEDLLAFLRRAKAGLKERGVLFVKENVQEKGFFLHKDDYSVTRSERLYQRLFTQAGLKVIRKTTQTGFPGDLYPVKLWALGPE